jgi:hypothetical protein
MGIGYWKIPNPFSTIGVMRFPPLHPTRFIPLRQDHDGAQKGMPKARRQRSDTDWNYLKSLNIAQTLFLKNNVNWHGWC